MRLVRAVLGAAFALSLLCGAARAEDWKPVSAEDLQLKELPDAKGAHAAILYYEDILNDKSRSSQSTSGSRSCLKRARSTPISSCRAIGAISR